MEQLAQRKKKIVIGVSGASGTIYAINLVKKLKRISAGRNTRNHQSMGKTELKAGIRFILNEFEKPVLITIIQTKIYRGCCRQRSF